MSYLKNAIIGQSGGPTAVINSSLAGAISEYINQENAGTMYGAVNGIKGIFREEFLNLSQIFKNKDNIDLLAQTPSAYLGSCRYKLKGTEEELNNIVSVFKKHDIGYFFYIGGNDSMDTVMKLSNICDKNNIKVIGIPKTIDNDLAETDHSPGYGSCAKYIASTISEMSQDASCYDIKNVLIVEIMGRNAGWLTASSALARNDQSTSPDLIYLPERPFDPEKFLFEIRQKLSYKHTVVVAVSEGIKNSEGKYIAEEENNSANDMFGHGQLGGVGKKLEFLVKNNLGIKVRSVELNIPQRCASHCMSLTDQTEAFRCGAKAVECAINGMSGKMIAMVRNNTPSYGVKFEPVDINLSANNERIVPDEFISSSGNDITDAFINYALPLIQGEKDIKFKNGIPAYISR